ncbi:hypothetical protein AA13595_1965 [Gluconacetobacter johannae DSM 13595]|nr:hypothetical protein AA13595_1965 [Gluconacetobacter johannae DSM 13595]
MKPACVPAVKPPAMMVIPISTVAVNTSRRVRTTGGVAGMKGATGVRTDRAVHRIAIYSAKAQHRCSTSRTGATAVLSGLKPEATMNQPMAPCSPPSTKNRTSRATSPRVSAPVTANHTSGTSSTSPIIRPQKRCVHSAQKIFWNPDRPKPSCRILYCGMVWYSANCRSHSAWVSGGTMPVTGRQSMIDRPEPVRRV